jgi:hypothetical protein
VSWRERARTPRGQAQFLAALFALAALASVCLGLARPVFEGFVRERFPQPSAAAIRLADAAATGSATAAELQSLSPEDFDGVYRAFMRQDPEVAGPVDGQRGDQLPPAPSGPLLAPGPLGRLLFGADAERSSALLRRTLIVGSPPQRERALLLTAEVRDCPALSALLSWASERATRTRDPQAELLRAAAERVGGAK